MPVKYVAEIENVREICLVGRANLEFWMARLGPLRLTPANFAGHARILISVVKLKWMGIAFQEFSIAVPIDPPDGSTPSIYLASAFSTSRFSAWCERTFFQTPYEHAEIMMHAEQPWSFELRDTTLGTLAVQCQRAAPTATVEEDWIGSIPAAYRPEVKAQVFSRETERPGTCGAVCGDFRRIPTTAVDRAAGHRAARRLAVRPDRMASSSQCDACAVEDVCWLMAVLSVVSRKAISCQPSGLRRKFFDPGPSTLRSSKCARFCRRRFEEPDHAYDARCSCFAAWWAA